MSINSTLRLCVTSCILLLTAIVPLQPLVAADIPPPPTDDSGLEPVVVGEFEELPVEEMGGEEVILTTPDTLTEEELQLDFSDLTLEQQAALEAFLGISTSELLEANNEEVTPEVTEAIERLFVPGDPETAAVVAPLTEVEREALENYDPLDPDDPYLDDLPAPIEEGNPNAFLPEGAVSCFDYYSFGSVQTSITSELGTLLNGTVVTPELTVYNENSYPVVDGNIYVKVFRRDDPDELIGSQGDSIVDQFFLSDTITLDAGETKQVSFDWDIPTYLPTGDYYFATYFSSAKKFNLMGLPFTDDVTGGTFDFQIASEQDTTVFFDKEQVTVAGEKHYFQAFIPVVEPREPTVVTATLVNETDTPQEIPVTYTLYGWDQQHPDNLEWEESETVLVPANDSLEVQRTIDPIIGEYSVSLLTIEAKYQDVKSIINVRFNRENVPAVRLNFPAVTSYPLEAGEPATLFSCVHGASNLDVIPGGTLVMNLLDRDGATLHTYQYEGGITGNMMAVKDEFTPARTLKNFTLEAVLYRDGELVEQESMVYNCEDIRGPEGDCTEAAVAAPSSNATTLGAVGGGALLVILLGGGIFFLRRWQKNRTSFEYQAPDWPTTVLLLGMLVTGGLLLAQVPTVEAANTTATKYSPGIWKYHTSWWNDNSNYANRWYNGLSHPTVNVNYYARPRTGNNNYLGSGSTLKVGDWFYINDFGRGNISFTGTGYSADTPPGYWKKHAKRLTNSPGYYRVKFGVMRAGTCTHGYLNKAWNGNWRDLVYVQLSVHPRNANRGFIGGTTAGVSCDSNGWCQVKSPGQIKLRYNFPSTYARFYHEWRPEGTPACLTSFELDPMRKGSNNHLDIPAKSINFTFTAVNSNNPPNQPTVSNNGPKNITAPVTITINATDPDGDKIRYGIDWDNNGTIDQWAPGSGYVNSGTARTANRSWSTSGNKTIRVRTQDENGSYSGWRSHTISVREDGVCGLHDSKNYDVTVNSWPSTGSFCSGGTVSPSSPTFPAPGNTTSWQCNGTNGGSSASCSAGRKTRPNLRFESFDQPTPAGGDMVSGTYSSLDITYRVENTGGSTAGSFTNEFEIDASINADSAVNSGVAGNSTVTRTVTFNDTISFGSHTLEWDVDDNNNVTESNENDNDGSGSFTLPPPPLAIILIADEFVRRGEPATLTWDLVASYPLECELNGAGFNSYDIISDGSPSQREGSAQSAGLQGESIFTLTCIEPITGAVSTAETSVEVLSSVEES